MILERHRWGPQAVYQAEKPGAPGSETKERERERKYLDVCSIIQVINKKLLLLCGCCVFSGRNVLSPIQVTSLVSAECRFL